MPKKLVIRESNIPGAGDGLFLLVPARKNEHVARFSGRVLNKKQMLESKSRYILKISDDVYLDAEGPNSWEGGKINCARKACVTANVKFPANRKVLFCECCGRGYVYISARFRLNASVENPLELVADYSKDYQWDRILDSYFFKHDEHKKNWPERKITKYLLKVAHLFLIMHENGIDEESIEDSSLNFSTLEFFARKIFEQTSNDAIYFVKHRSPRLKYEQCIHRFISNHRKVVNNISELFHQFEPVESLPVIKLQWWARRIGFEERPTLEDIMGPYHELCQQLSKEEKKQEKQTYWASIIRQFFQEHHDYCIPIALTTPSEDFFHFLRLQLITYRQKLVGSEQSTSINLMDSGEDVRISMSRDRDDTFFETATEEWALGWHRKEVYPVFPNFMDATCCTLAVNDLVELTKDQSSAPRRLRSYYDRGWASWMSTHRRGWAAFIVWSVVNMRNRSNWRVTTLKNSRNILALITKFALPTKVF